MRAARTMRAFLNTETNTLGKVEETDAGLEAFARLAKWPRYDEGKPAAPYTIVDVVVTVAEGQG